MNKQKVNNSSQIADGPFCLGASALVLCAVGWKYEHAIKYWLHENLMWVVLAVFAVLAGFAFIALQRIKKKEKDFFERRRALRAVRPERARTNYFERRR